MTHISDIDVRKAELRKQARTARAAVPSEARVDAAEQIAGILRTVPEISDAGVIMAYGATPEELDPSKFLDLARQAGVRIVLPRVEDGAQLSLRIVRDAHDLEVGTFGLRQPTAAAKRIGSDEPDVILVPGLAFDPTGGRLGYGAGYYDRLLPELRPDALTIGIAFDAQMVDEVPVADHDVRVKALATPTRFLRFGAQR